MIQEVRVTNEKDKDPAGAGLLAEVRRTFGIQSINHIRTVRVYRLEGIEEVDAQRFAEQVLCENVNQKMSMNCSLITDAQMTVEVAYKPGVMNPEAASIMKTAKDLGLNALVAVDSSTEYHFYPSEGLDDLQRVAFFGALPHDVRAVVDRLLVNKTVSQVVTEPPTTLLFSGDTPPVVRVPIRELDDEGLMALSKDKLFLNLEEMHVIQEYFRTLGRDPTDAEVETLAQTWSEHCGHKTFNARIIMHGKEKPPFMKRLKDASHTWFDFVVSAFEDNAGALVFYDGYAVCAKVETHNGPSYIEPYAGANTGVGGVLRDVMGFAKGAKVLLSTNIYFLAHWQILAEQVLAGALHPDYLLRRIIEGVRDYGNRMGVPTANGSFHFHPDCQAKPTVIVGAYGIIPVQQAQKGIPTAGDKIIVVGGRTGRDGIHGATFSSGAMTDRTNSVNASAVQIGNPIEEKRTSDALLTCRNDVLIEAITDCGAGGFSSAIGEMGSKTGVRVELEKAPLKYPGLAPWEIWISESQERMVMAVAPSRVERVLEICRNYNVEATVLGEFTDDKRLTVKYGDETVCDLDMEFLHNGLPQRVLEAHWQRPEFEEPTFNVPSNWNAAYCRVMEHPNVCSKEPVVRMYDHGVQGTNALPPYGGMHHDAPNDAVVLRPLPDKPYGLVVAHGLNPILNRIDPYWGTLWAITEAMANYVAVGGDPSQVGLVDNFIWPAPTPQMLGALDKAVDACVDAVHIFKRPFVSGKDSLSSTYKGKDGTIVEIPPVLCASVFGRIDDVTQTVSSDFKKPGSHIVLLGNLDPSSMAGSVWYDLHGAVGNALPKVDRELLLQTFRKVHELIKGGHILACHDVSEGGIAVALAEMCFGSDYGADIDLTTLGIGRLDSLFFNEMAGCFLLEMTNEDLHRVMGSNMKYSLLGKTIKQPLIKVHAGHDLLFTAAIDDLKRAWKAPMKEVFP